VRREERRLLLALVDAHPWRNSSLWPWHGRGGVRGHGMAAAEAVAIIEELFQWSNGVD
jgi:hypothetical protein